LIGAPQELAFLAAFAVRRAALIQWKAALHSTIEAQVGDGTNKENDHLDLLFKPGGVSYSLNFLFPPHHTTPHHSWMATTCVHSLYAPAEDAVCSTLG
jgi:hypothetical protein